MIFESFIKSQGVKMSKNKLKTDNILVSKLRTWIKGRIITPDDEGYDQARTVFYGGIDRRPALIIRAADAEEVSRVISLARETGLELAIRSGGHSISGYSVTDGGIVLDLSDMRALQINVNECTAWAEAGLTAGEYTNAVAEHGLVTGFGDTASVGIGGLTLGGGLGYLVRKYGLTIDDLLAADIVTADGQLLRVDTETHPDLFWTIRGGGGNFGVVTRFKYRLHQLESVVGGMLVLPATLDVIASFVAEADAAPEELSIIANIMIAPPMPFLPKEVHGKPVVMATLVYAGEVEAGERVIARFRALASPLADMVRQMRYPEIFQPEPEGYHPISSVSTLFVDRIDRPESEMILDHLKESTSSMAVAQLRVLGGAMARIPAEATAFAHRRSRIMVNLAALYENPADRVTHESWVTGFAASLRQSDSGAYVNFLSDEGQARVRAAYPGETWDRLVAIKARYDPTNLFHLNQNILPASKNDQS
jgi:FAD/FMN-containing dehydrogenase